LNQRNSVGMKLDPEICGRMLAGKFKFNSNPKWNKDTGKHETKQEVERRHETWKHLHTSMPLIMQQIGNHTFYMNHTKDVRGRVYCSGYEVSYQGIDVQKAMVSLQKTVIIEPTF
jgi:DNA-directed RNA polymerase